MTNTYFDINTPITDCGLTLKQCGDVLLGITGPHQKILTKVGQYIIKRTDQGTIKYAKEYLKDYNGTVLVYVSPNGEFYLPDDLLQIINIKLFDSNEIFISAYFNLPEMKLMVHFPNHEREEILIDITFQDEEDKTIITSNILINEIPFYWYLVLRCLTCGDDFFSETKIINFLKRNKKMLDIDKSITEKRFNDVISHYKNYKNSSENLMKFFENRHIMEPRYHIITDTLYITINDDRYIAFNGKEAYDLVVNDNDNILYGKCHTNEFVYEIIIKKLIMDIARHGISMKRCEMLRMFASFL